MDNTIPEEILRFLSSGCSFSKEDKTYYFMPLVFEIDNNTNSFTIHKEGSYIPIEAKYYFKKHVNKVLDFSNDN